MTIEEIKKDAKYWQRLLRLAGYYNAGIDGIKGAKQTQAEKQWQDAVEQSKGKYGELDSRSESNLATVLPAMQDAIRSYLNSKAVKAWQQQKGIVIKVIQGTRSYAEQDRLYAQGRTTKGTKVTNAKGGYSLHNFGIAVDLGLFKDGKYLEADTEYKNLVKSCGIPTGTEWGGNWKSIVDTPHFQLAKYGSSSASIRKIF